MMADTAEEREFQAMLRRLGVEKSKSRPATPSVGDDDSYEAMMKRLGIETPKGGWSSEPMVNRPRPAPKVPPKRVPPWKQRRNKYEQYSTEALKQELKDIAASPYKIRTELRPRTINEILDERERDLYDVNEVAMRHGGLVGEAETLQNAGRGGDNMLVHMNPEEVGALNQLGDSGIGGLRKAQMTINPQTGLPEMFQLSSLLPMIAGIAATAMGAGPLYAAAAAAAGSAGADVIEDRPIDAGRAVLSGVGQYAGATIAGQIGAAGVPAASASELGATQMLAGQAGAAGTPASQALLGQAAQSSSGQLAAQVAEQEAIRAAASQAAQPTALGVAGPGLLGPPAAPTSFPGPLPDPNMPLAGTYDTGMAFGEASPGGVGSGGYVVPPEATTGAAVQAPGLEYFPPDFEAFPPTYADANVQADRTLISPEYLDVARNRPGAYDAAVQAPGGAAQFSQQDIARNLGGETWQNDAWGNLQRGAGKISPFEWEASKAGEIGLGEIAQPAMVAFGATAGAMPPPEWGPYERETYGSSSTGPAAWENRRYVEPPAGYRPGEDPEHKYWQPKDEFDTLPMMANNGYRGRNDLPTVNAFGGSDIINKFKSTGVIKDGGASGQDALEGQFRNWMEHRPTGSGGFGGFSRGLGGLFGKLGDWATPSAGFGPPKPIREWTQKNLPDWFETLQDPINITPKLEKFYSKAPQFLTGGLDYSSEDPGYQPPPPLDVTGDEDEEEQDLLGIQQDLPTVNAAGGTFPYGFKQAVVDWSTPIAGFGPPKPTYEWTKQNLPDWFQTLQDPLNMVPKIEKKLAKMPKWSILGESYKRSMDPNIGLKEPAYQEEPAFDADAFRDRRMYEDEDEDEEEQDLLTVNAAEGSRSDGGYNTGGLKALMGGVLPQLAMMYLGKEGGDIGYGSPEDVSEPSPDDLLQQPPETGWSADDITQSLYSNAAPGYQRARFALGTEGMVVEDAAAQQLSLPEAVTTGIMDVAPPAAQDALGERMAVTPSPNEPQNPEERAILEQALLALEGLLDPEAASQAITEFINTFGAEAYRELMALVENDLDGGGIVKPANGETTVAMGEVQGPDAIPGNIVDPMTGERTANLNVGENEYIEPADSLARRAMAAGMPRTPENGALVRGAEEDELEAMYG